MRAASAADFAAGFRPAIGVAGALAAVGVIAAVALPRCHAAFHR